MSAPTESDRRPHAGEGVTPLAGRRLETRQRDRHGALAAAAQRLQWCQAGRGAQAVPLPPCEPSAACAAARRAIGTR